MIPKIGPRQYPISKPQVNNEEEAKKASTETEQEGDNLQQSKGLAYTQDSQTQLPSAEATRSNLVQTPQQHSEITNENGLCKSHTPLSQRSTKINIAQILKDFKNTAIAIATPDDLMEEVDGYIGLIKKQVTKESPNIKLIQANLNNCF